MIAIMSLTMFVFLTPYILQAAHRTPVTNTAVQALKLRLCSRWCWPVEGSVPDWSCQRNWTSALLQQLPISACVNKKTDRQTGGLSPHIMCLRSVQHHICKYRLTVQSDWINTVTLIYRY